MAAAQQGGSVWSPYQRVPNYLDDTLPPYLIADQNRTVHAFTSQWVGEGVRQLAIVYRQWSLDGGWTLPVDVILSPLKEARLTGVTLDEKGIFHVIYWGGDDLGANIYYNSAPATQAGNTQSWSQSVSIGRNAITPTTADIVKRGENIVVVYSGNVEGVGLNAVYSDDGGKTWSEPELIYLVDSSGLQPFSIQLLEGADGLIYLIWTIVDGAGHNIGGFFSRMDLADRKWSTPVQFADSVGTDQGMGIANPNMIEHKDSLLIMFNNGIPPVGVPPAQYVVSSSDHGETWSTPLRAFPNHVGRNGVVSMLIDSTDTLHTLFAQRIPLSINNSYAERNGVWHSWQEIGGWVEPEEIVGITSQPGQQVPQSVNTYPIGGYDVRGVVSQGNVILATWREDPGGGNTGVRFSYTLLDASELSVQALPEVVLDTQIPPTLTEATTQVPADSLETGEIGNLNEPPPGSNPSSSPSTVLLVALVPVIVILGGIILFRRVFS